MVRLIWPGSDIYQLADFELDSLTALSYTLSTDQRDLVLEQGCPESFIILFCQVPAPGGAEQSIRLIIWDCY
jgi:hypothetical protein